ncbi:hypothetical protein O9G_001964 [Rozella allomycis CSF55]|uniref:Uncharacterized protein n=1 Tax=Rozella allomycis (strain CSF55) TaxID=988480 RepID=A0A075APE2_ROZAC|nr:hypothetical protein O9G_001964 [Rozella allomycis CSF55]|eukprot:EPZ31954.1 hypothetical protein O9G_001964 [Rozella allomycis CSF55]
MIFYSKLSIFILVLVICKDVYATLKNLPTPPRDKGHLHEKSKKEQTKGFIMNQEQVDWSFEMLESIFNEFETSQESHTTIGIVSEGYEAIVAKHQVQYPDPKYKKYVQSTLEHYAVVKCQNCLVGTILRRVREQISLKNDLLALKPAEIIEKVHQEATVATPGLNDPCLLEMRILPYNEHIPILWAKLKTLIEENGRILSLEEMEKKLSKYYPSMSETSFNLYSVVSADLIRAKKHAVLDWLKHNIFGPLYNQPEDYIIFFSMLQKHFERVIKHTGNKIPSFFNTLIPKEYIVACALEQSMLKFSKEEAIKIARDIFQDIFVTIQNFSRNKAIENSIDLLFGLRLKLHINESSDLETIKKLIHGFIQIKNSHDSSKDNFDEKPYVAEVEQPKVLLDAHLILRSTTDYLNSIQPQINSLINKLSPMISEWKDNYLKASIMEIYKTDLDFSQSQKDHFRKIVLQYPTFNEITEKEIDELFYSLQSYFNEDGSFNGSKKLKFKSSIEVYKKELNDNLLQMDIIYLPLAKELFDLVSKKYYLYVISAFLNTLAARALWNPRAAIRDFDELKEGLIDYSKHYFIAEKAKNINFFHDNVGPLIMYAFSHIYQDIHMNIKIQRSVDSFIALLFGAQNIK